MIADGYLSSVFREGFPIHYACKIGDGFADMAQRSQKLHYIQTRTPLVKHIDELLDAVYFETEAETILPENIEKTKNAFRKFLKHVDLPLSAYTFEDILKENTGPDEFRGDGKVPNWYHFFRQVLPKLTAIKARKISEDTLAKHGGLDALIAGTLYHDSWEDHGRDPMQIFTGLQRHAETLLSQGQISEQRCYDMHHQAAVVKTLVDLCSRQIPIRDEFGRFVKKESGSLEKEPRFDGNLNVFYNRQLHHPFAVWIKTDDANEGVSTLIMPDTLERAAKDKFSVQRNIKHARKIRSFYWRRANTTLAIERFSEFKQALRASDSMLSINLVILESLNDYAMDEQLKPLHAKPVDLREDQDIAWPAHKDIPPGWRSDRIQTDRIENLINQDRPRIGGFLDYVIYPAIPKFVMDRIDLGTQHLNATFHCVPNEA